MSDISHHTKPSLLYFVTEDWYFCSHRLPLAMAALDAGYEVSVVTRESVHGDRIRSAGIKLIPSPVRRSGMSPLEEIKGLIRLVAIYRRERPDILHHVAMKPVIYGSIAALLTRCRKTVNALGGLGYVFIGSRLKARILRPVVTALFRWLFSRQGSRLVLQNADDRDLLAGVGAVDPANVVLIRGSGVDLRSYSPVPSRDASDRPVVVLASRMLWDKGVGEFVSAARELKAQGAEARFVLVGDSDPDNPSAIPAETLRSWQDEEVVEWFGERHDMPEVFAQADMVVLPSYREGLPKVLIEAAACGKPIVTTDVPGCREVVVNGDNGLLVPARDAKALASAIRELLNDPVRREAMGRRGRERAEAEFGLDKVIQQTLALYRELLE